MTQTRPSEPGPLDPEVESPQHPDPSGIAALATFRKMRRSHRRHGVDPFDAFYRVYVTGLFGLLAFYIALGFVDDVAVDTRSIEWVGSNGPLWIGLVAAVAIAVGVRSGANGGPLAIDELEFHHVLMSPLDRSAVLSDPVRRLIVSAGAISVVIGAAAGELASRRLPGDQFGWIIAGVLAGSAIAISGVGAALTTAAVGLSRGWATLIAGALVASAAAAVALGAPASPTSGFGDLALWPLTHRPTAIVGIVVPVVLLGLGLLRVGALAIERAHRRSRLVAQFRFALAQQDVRALLLLRRQLAFETPRRRPWLTVRAGGAIERRFPILLRDLRSYLRWPIARILRVVGLAAVAGLSLAGMWEGTTALIAVVGVTLYLAAIEVIEPLSQEFDHPGIVELLPIKRGHILLGHILSAAVAMTAVWAIVGVVAMTATLDWRVGAATAVAAVPAAVAAVAAAVLSINRLDTPDIAVPDEVAGPKLLLRLVWPPALTLFGAVPVLMARNAVADGYPGTPAAANMAVFVALVAAAAVAWIRFRDDFTDATAEAKAQR